MPELPEVETIRLGLQKYLVGKKIADAEIRLPKMVSGDTAHVIGAVVKDVKRFGKGLVIDLSNGYSLAIHIKLTGQLIYQGTKETEETKGTKGLSPKVGGKLPNKFTHVIFEIKNQKSNLKNITQNSKIQDEAKLYYNDLRQFGWIKILKTEDVKDLPFFKSLGPEPPVAKSNSALEGQGPLTLESFKNIVKKGNIAIKPLLLDQKRMSGIGNIYANDGLYAARIDPRRKAKTLTDEEIKTLYESVLSVLKKGLATGGASELQFVNVLGKDGGYQKHFLAYGQQGKPCSRCRTKIQKFMLGGRGTYMCPMCQK